MDRTFFACGAILAFIAVAAGAFGAHGLKSKIPAEMLTVFEVGVRYHMYHALALFIVSWAYSRWPNSLVISSGWLFIIGIILFSGSLYALSISGVRILGAITPFGGLAFLAGWFCLFWVAIKK